MFDKQLRITGSHARYISELKQEREEFGETGFFSRYLDIYTLAPLVGFLYQRKGKKNEVVRIADKDCTRSVMLEEVLQGRPRLEFAYRLILLLDAEHEPDVEARIDKAFRTEPGKNWEDEQLFDAYMLGGIEVLYEQLVDPAHESAAGSDPLSRLFGFLDEFQRERYEESFEGVKDAILRACLSPSGAE